MLHDPRHDGEPTLAAFALFVAGKEPGERYNWEICCECPVGQFLSSLGMNYNMSWTGELALMNKLAGDVSKDNEPPKFMRDWTWGGLADRILKYQMENVHDSALAYA
jgi:hypothetical protein